MAQLPDHPMADHGVADRLADGEADQGWLFLTAEGDMDHDTTRSATTPAAQRMREVALSHQTMTTREQETRPRRSGERGHGLDGS